MRPPHRLALLLCDEHGRAHAVPDLPAVERFAAPPLGHEVVENGALGGRDDGVTAEVLDEDGPDFGAAAAVQLRKTEADVDAGLEGLVEGAHAVGGEEEDAIKVLEGTKED